jgi:hypothetical protein
VDVESFNSVIGTIRDALPSLDKVAFVSSGQAPRFHDVSAAWHGASQVRRGIGESQPVFTKAVSYEEEDLARESSEERSVDGSGGAY